VNGPDAVGARQIQYFGQHARRAELLYHGPHGAVGEQNAPIVQIFDDVRGHKIRRPRKIPACARIPSLFSIIPANGHKSNAYVEKVRGKCL
jgi:hypothetical protein